MGGLGWTEGVMSIVYAHLASVRVAVLHSTAAKHSKAQHSILRSHRVQNRLLLYVCQNITSQHSNGVDEKAASCVSSVNCAREWQVLSEEVVVSKGARQCMQHHDGRVHLCTYLYQRILSVNIPVIALAKYLNILPQLFCLGHAHDSPPLIMDLDTIHVAVCLLLLLSLNQTQPSSHASKLLHCRQNKALPCQVH